MSQDQLRSQLEAKLDELQRRLESIKRDVAQSHSSDSAEQAQERENDEVVDCDRRCRELHIPGVQVRRVLPDIGSHIDCAGLT